MEQLRKLLLENSYYSGSDFNLTEDEANQVLALSIQLIPEYLMYKGLSTANKDAKLPLLKYYISKSPNFTLEMEMYLTVIMVEAFSKIEENDFFIFTALQESYAVLKSKTKEDIVHEFEHIKSLPRLDTDVLFANSTARIKELQAILKDFNLTVPNKTNLPNIIRVLKSLVKPEDSFDDRILLIMFLDFIVNMYKKTSKLENLKKHLEDLPKDGKVGLSDLGDIMDIIANADVDISLEGLEGLDLEQDDEEEDEDD